MARHRDIRNMDFRDDYDGYDDIYGHSVDDDYCISPSNRQYIYNRESSTRSSESDIKEEDELEAQLSDLERARLESCIDQIKSTLGASSLNRTQLVNIIVSQEYNIEKCLNAILEETSGKKAYSVKEKDLTKKQFFIPKLNGLTNPSSSPKTKFIIPNLFNKSSQEDIMKKNPNFIIPTFGKPLNNLNSTDLSSSLNNKEFKSLSEVVSNHLYSQIVTLNEELKNITLQKESTSAISKEQLNADLLNSIDQLNIVQDTPLPCSFDCKDFLKNDFKLKKSRTKFAKVLCRHYRKLVLKLSEKEGTSKKIKTFNFKTPSPDDFVRKNLRR